jgi:mannose-1-phosphate guanylyltransferase
MEMKEKYIGMILAAGFGTRLRPLTNDIPKPLIPLAGKPLIYYPITALKTAGVTDIVVNIHHLHEKFYNILGDGSQFGVNIVYSYEEKEILGTGGGIKFASKLFSERSVIVYNGDVISNCSISRMIIQHELSGALATMAIRPEEQGSGYSRLIIDRKTDNIIDISGLCDKSASGMYVNFEGIHLLSTEAVGYLRPIFSSVIDDLYIKAIKSGRKIGAFFHDGYWNDLGTMERYSQAEIDISSGRTTIDN